MNDKTETTQAALDPVDAFIQEAIESTSDEVTTTESAPATEESTNESNPVEAEKPKEDGFQKRVDKITADKYAEKRRADDLQKRLDEALAKQDKQELVKPKLDDPAIDYDEEAFDKANRDYEIKQGVQSALAEQSAKAQAEQQKAEQEKAISTFNQRANAMGKSDFDVKAQSIPNLPAGVADAIMQSEDGAEMVYHLGSNLEKAEALANMTPASAMMELGRISAQLSAKPEIKTSAAPDPITPVKSGSALSSDISDDMSMSEWMSKYG